MVGITLSPEQIRSAPPEVRRWLEHQLAISLGLGQGSAPERGRGLIALRASETADLFMMIEKMFPVVTVFFELGRVGESIGQDDIEAFRLTEIMRHARLDTMEQLLACLKTINEAARYIRRDPESELCLIEPDGYCFIAAETQKAIFELWQRIVAQHELPDTAGFVGAQPVAAEPSSVHIAGRIPSSALHMSPPGVELPSALKEGPDASPPSRIGSPG